MSSRLRMPGHRFLPRQYRILRRLVLHFARPRDRLLARNPNASCLLYCTISSFSTFHFIHSLHFLPCSVTLILIQNPPSPRKAGQSEELNGSEGQMERGRRLELRFLEEHSAFETAQEQALSMMRNIQFLHTTLSSDFGIVRYCYAIFLIFRVFIRCISCCCCPRTISRSVLSSSEFGQLRGF
jgi:hypothetical protein